MEKNIEGSILGFLDRLPILSYYANTRGWKFILSWSHRIAGLILVLYLLLHIYTLSLLSSPSLFAAKMVYYDSFLFKFLEWILAIPLIFHALNGARLILYESFGHRDDRKMITWASYLGFIYLCLLGFFILLGNQNVSVLFFWLNTFIISIIFFYYLYRKIWKTQNSRLWKLQRISGAFLLVMLPAHMIFMHINYSVGHDAATVIARMQHFSIKILDLLLVIVVLYHASFGIYTIIEDYTKNKILRKCLTVILLLIAVCFGYIGAKFTLFLT